MRVTEAKRGKTCEPIKIDFGFTLDWMEKVIFFFAANRKA